MKISKQLPAALAVLALLVLASAAFAEQAPQKVYDLAKGELAAYGTDPVIVAAVKAQNAKRMSMADIEAMDGKWKAESGVAPYMRALMDSECGKRLQELRDSKPYFAEIFVMDGQGADVAMSDKTSDYWQGDEAKFQKSFAGGSGAVFVDEVEFDDSTQNYLVQVSVPVMDGVRAIGAITFGIAVDNI